MEERLWQTIDRLQTLAPDFVSVTYGAGGSTKEPTGRTVSRLIHDTGLNTAAHLTCVNASKEQVNEVVREYQSFGVERFVALRGDPATGVGTSYVPHPDGYQSSPDLIAGLKEIADFDISVSAYPEKHPESRDFATDIEILKRKVDAGADRAITQFFFDNDVYEEYVERVRRAGIYIPILPGILPVHNFRQVTNFCARSGTHVPSWLAERFEGLDDDPQTHALVASAVAAEQVLDLIERGVQDFHFYTMNRSDLVFAICHLIGIRPVQSVFAEQSAA
jgi:methylenetetrahydrofolate reductase (NADPH)